MDAVTVLDDPDRPRGGICFCPNVARSGWGHYTKWNKLGLLRNPVWRLVIEKNPKLPAQLDKMTVKSCRIAQQDRIGN